MYFNKADRSPQALFQNREAPSTTNSNTIKLHDINEKGHRVPRKTSLGVSKPIGLVQTNRTNHSTPVHHHQGPQPPNNSATPQQQKSFTNLIHISHLKMISVSFHIVDDRVLNSSVFWQTFDQSINDRYHPSPNILKTTKNPPPNKQHQSTNSLTKPTSMTPTFQPKVNQLISSSPGCSLNTRILHQM